MTAASTAPVLGGPRQIAFVGDGGKDAKIGKREVLHMENPNACSEKPNETFEKDRWLKNFLKHNMRRDS